MALGCTGFSGTAVLAEETAGENVERKSVSWQGAQVLGGQTDQIYFGSYYLSDTSKSTKEPVLWRVLENSGDQIYLMADSVLDAMAYQTPHANSVSWETSTLRTWLNSQDGFLGTAFTEAEQAAAVSEEVAYDVRSQGDGQGSCTDVISALSLADAMNEDYGFTKKIVSEDEGRKALHTTYTASLLGGTEGETAKYWLRSLGTNVMNASFVDENGKVGDYQSSYLDAADTSTAVRPVFWLNPEAVIYLTADSQDKTAEFAGTADLTEGTVWYAAVSDGNMEFAAELETSEAAAGDTLPVSIVSLGAEELSRAYTQISAVLLDENGSAVCSGKIAESTDTTAEVVLPENLEAGSYRLEVFAEAVYSSDETAADRTDLGSNTAEFEVTVS